MLWATDSANFKGSGESLSQGEASHGYTEAEDPSGPQGMEVCGHEIYLVVSCFFV